MNTLIVGKKLVHKFSCADENDVWDVLSRMAENSDPYYNTIELFDGIHVIYNDGVLEKRTFRNKLVENLAQERLHSNCAIVKFDSSWDLLDFTDDDVSNILTLMNYKGELHETDI